MMMHPSCRTRNHTNFMLVATNGRSNEESERCHSSTLCLPCISICGVLSPSVYYVCFVEATLCYLHIHILNTSDSDLRPAGPGSVFRHKSAEQCYIAPGWLVYIYHSMF